ncbi:MAG: hypothetical protein JXB05_21875, partial [Myxococcaceae bacterium]|nr:hypothetical protein [Myxococcaceae bacterium]
MAPQGLSISVPQGTRHVPSPLDDSLPVQMGLHPCGHAPEGALQRLDEQEVPGAPGHQGGLPQ